MYYVRRILLSNGKTAVHPLNMGLRVIGVVKTATRRYPMTELSHMPFRALGDHRSYVNVTADGVIDLMAVMWDDRNGRFFISNASTRLNARPYERVRWREGGEESRLVAMSVLMPIETQGYYDCGSQIGRLNRCRQDDVGLE